MCSLHFASQGLYRVSVEEGIISNPDLQVGCVDVRGEPVPTVKYNITSGNSGPFYVDTINGSVLVIEGEMADYDQGSDFYTFTVECTDLENPEDHDSVLVNITIHPVNKFFPELSVTTISVNVSETLEVGTTIVSTEQPSLNIFSALDRDRGEHGRIRYSFSRLNQDSNHPIILPFLQLNPSTGALVVIRSLDSNLPLTVSDFALDVIRVTVCDRENDRDDDQCPNLAVQIRVDSVNEFTIQDSPKKCITHQFQNQPMWEHILLKLISRSNVG